jgi:DNA modification methylase
LAERVGAWRRIAPRQGGPLSAAEAKRQLPEGDQREVVKTRNMRDVWSIPTEPYKGKHYATFPRALARRCILAGSRPGDLVFDPFIGSGTVAQVCIELSRSYVGIDLDPRNEELQARRVAGVQRELVA